MKIISPLPRKRGRLEIIPLIDIMFFLLAAFMVVSLHKIKVDSLKINLPTDVPSPTHETKEDFVSISMDDVGQVQIDKEKITSKEELEAKLAAMYAANHDQKILISADRETHHGDVMQMLAKIRQAGFQKVAFALKREAAPVSNGAAPAVEGATPNAPGAAPVPPTPSVPGATAAPVAPAAPAAPGAAAPAPASAAPAPVAPAGPVAPAAPAPAAPPAPAAAPAPAAPPAPAAQ
jgi:biopolymer transport protein ExbD